MAMLLSLVSLFTMDRSLWVVVYHLYGFRRQWRTRFRERPFFYRPLILTPRPKTCVPFASAHLFSAELKWKSPSSLLLITVLLCWILSTKIWFLTWNVTTRRLYMMQCVQLHVLLLIKFRVISRWLTENEKFESRLLVKKHSIFVSCNVFISFKFRDFLDSLVTWRCESVLFRCQSCRREHQTSLALHHRTIFCLVGSRSIPVNRL